MSPGKKLLGSSNRFKGSLHANFYTPGTFPSCRKVCCGGKGGG